jgi:hypothetical protein
LQKALVLLGSDSLDYDIASNNRDAGPRPAQVCDKPVALDAVSQRQAWRTRQDILEATPRNIGVPERAARQCMPLDFCLQKSRW